MGANRRFMIFSVDGIVHAMRRGCSYQVGNIARAYGAKTNDVRRFLDQAVSLGLCEKFHDAGRGEWLYRLPEPKKPETVGPPYRSLRLTENIEGYESSLSRFASLCMMVRR